MFDFSNLPIWAQILLQTPANHQSFTAHETMDNATPNLPAEDGTVGLKPSLA